MLNVGRIFITFKMNEKKNRNIKKFILKEIFKWILCYQRSRKVTKKGMLRQNQEHQVWI